LIDVQYKWALKLCIKSSHPGQLSIWIIDESAVTAVVGDWMNQACFCAVCQVSSSHTAKLLSTTDQLPA
jgi:hypothetical protein